LMVFHRAFSGVVCGQHQGNIFLEKAQQPLQIG
jgi:hypothetical protein